MQRIDICKTLAQITFIFFQNVANATNIMAYNINHKSSVHQGEVLMLLVHRAKIQIQEAAKLLEINKSHLSRIFRSELLSDNVRQRACRVFSVPESVFFDGGGFVGDAVGEPEIPYGLRVSDTLTAAEVLKYLHEKDQQHAAERVLLLKIIDNLTLKK